LDDSGLDEAKEKDESHGIINDSKNFAPYLRLSKIEGAFW
jgi:hypothetical protein